MNDTIYNAIQNVYAHRTETMYENAVKCSDNIKSGLLNAYDCFQNGRMDAGFDHLYYALEKYFGCDPSEINMYKDLGASRQELYDMIYEKLPFDNSYSRKVTDIIFDDVVQDLRECSDLKAWNDSDLSLAIGRVLCKKLGCSI